MRAERSERPVISFVTLVLSHYRVPFHERVRALLAERGVGYQLIYSDPLGDARDKGDTVDLEWATKVPVRRYRLGGAELYWQDARRLTRDSALTVVSQENKLLLNYCLVARSKLGFGRFAYFGHGRNHQADRSDGFGERLKRRLATEADWWFAYTSGVRDLLAGYGYPADRITVNENAIDTNDLRARIEAVRPQDIRQLRDRLGLQSGNIGLFVGGLYEHKRLDYLIEAADMIRRRVPDFELIIAGSGPQTGLVESAARHRSYVHAVGPVFGSEKAQLLKVASVILMPGLVGLAILDSFVAGCPMITTDVDFHSPEIDYLTDRENGLMIADAPGPQAYADAVSAVLEDEVLRGHLANGALNSGRIYTVEGMARNVADGMLRAIGEKPVAVPRTPSEFSTTVCH